MNAAINFFVLMVFLFVTLAQTHSVSPRVGYGVAIPLAVIAIILAVVRYKQRKDRGE
jgi:uncharacterized membrane-anchored protein